MLGNALLGCAVLLGVTMADIAAPVHSAPRLEGGTAHAPTYWVMMVSGEKQGAPWLETSTPATLGGTVKETGPWSCAYPATRHGSDADFGFERMELSCAVGEAEVFMEVRCNFRTKPKAGKVPGKGWTRGVLQTLNLRRKGDPTSTITVSLRCDVDAALSAE